jgi:hypothetical protein
VKVGDDLRFRGLTSTGATVTITTPDANTVNLEAVGGGGSFTTTNIGYVDVTLGNDGTAAVGDPALPFLTIKAACAAAASGQAIVVRPGTYVESNIIVPDGVTVIGTSWQSVRVGDPAAAFPVFDLGNNTYLEGFGIEVPATVDKAGVLFNGPAGGFAAVNLITFFGDGLSPGRAGDGLHKTGTGKVVAFEIRTELGGMNSLQRVDGGVLAVESTHVPNSAGRIASVALVGAGRFQSTGFNVGNVNVVRCLEITNASAIVRVFSVNWFDPAGAAGTLVGLYLGVDGADVEIVGGSIETALSVELDLLVGYTSASRVLLNVVQEPKFSFPPSGLNVDFTVVFQQRTTDTRDSETRTLGTAVTSGFPEKGSALVGGEGGSYSDGVRVFTSTGAAAGTDGINITEITAAAVGKSAPTFTFPTAPAAAGDTITFTTQRFDATGASLAFYGVDILQTLGALDGAGAVPAPGTFAFEVWTGAAWTEIGVMAVSTEDTFRYADDLFQRPIPVGTSDETIRFGLYDKVLANDTTLTWTPKTIAAAIASGTQLWCRIRVIATLTQSPIFQRLQLLTSTTTINTVGRRLATGLALWQTRLFTSGGVWGSSAGVANGSYTVGNGGVFPGETSYDINRSKLNGANDQVTFQFPLPAGLCTAFPLTLRPEIHLLNSGVNVTTAGVMTVGAYPLQVAGVKVADPTGGTAPVARSYANTNLLSTLTGQGFAENIIPPGEGAAFTTKASIFELDFSPYIVSSVYSDDVIAIALEYTSDSTPATDVQIWTLEIEGVAFLDGSSITEL